MARGYWPEDVAFFLRLGPYLALSTERRARQRLAAEHDVLVECQSSLASYPDLQIEPLAFWYATLRGIGALDVPFLNALLQDCTWRGIVWGGWLALVAPEAEYLPLLRAVPATAHGNEWAARCAQAHLEGHEPEEPLRNLAKLVAHCRELLRAANIVRMPLRLQPNAEQVAACERVRDAYRSRGSAEALKTLRALGLNELTMPYAEWYRTTLR